MHQYSARLWFALGLTCWAMGSQAGGGTGTCIIHCDRALAQCEQKLDDARSGRCPLTHQNCVTDCQSARKADHRTAAERKKAVCQQRCDLSEHQCTDANPHDSGACAKGLQGCRARCD